MNRESTASLKRIFAYFKPYKLQAAGAIICVMVVTSIVVAAPFIFKFLVEGILVKKDFRMLNIFVVGVALAIVVKEVFTYGQFYLASFVGLRVVADIRQKLFDHIMGMSVDFFFRWRTGDLISRIINDLTVIQNSISNNFVRLVNHSIVLIGLIIIIIITNWKLAVLTGIIIPLVGYVISSFGTGVGRATGLAQIKIASLSGVLKETLSGVKVVKSFSMEEAEKKRFRTINEKNFSLSLKSAQFSATQEPVVEFISIIGILAVLWYCGRAYILGQITIGQITAFFSCIALSIDPIVVITYSYSAWQQAISSEKRINEILQARSTVIESPDAIELSGLLGDVKYDGISFYYEDRKIVLDKINFSVKSGEKVALVGPSGAGKTTIISLLLRFYDPVSGSVSIDGTDIRKIKIESLRSRIGVVHQDVFLFSGTILENIRYGRAGASMEEVMEAAKEAYAHDFIMSFPDGYQTKIGEQGEGLSGGEKQRISIARVMLKKPSLVILDEATSALDSESDRLVRAALEKLMRGRTTFVIAHSFNTLVSMDRIFVISDGRIAQEGRHQELIRQEGIYKDLYDKQLLFAEGGEIS